jgi:hypothetical protein
VLGFARGFVCRFVHIMLSIYCEEL